MKPAHKSFLIAFCLFVSPVQAGGESFKHSLKKVSNTVSSTFEWAGPYVKPALVAYAASELGYKVFCKSYTLFTGNKVGADLRIQQLESLNEVLAKAVLANSERLDKLYKIGENGDATGEIVDLAKMLNALKEQDFSKFVTTERLATALKPYAKTADVPGLVDLSGYVKRASFSAAIATALKPITDTGDENSLASKLTAAMSRLDAWEATTSDDEEDIESPDDEEGTD